MSHAGAAASTSTAGSIPFTRAGNSRAGTASRGGSNPCAISNPFKALNDDTWLHNRPEKDVYKLQLDAHRLRLDDEYKFRGDVSECPAQEFHDLLIKAERRRGGKILPAWCNQTKRQECERAARQDLGIDGCFMLEKSDVVEEYGGDSMMPMQLRMLAEEILGKPLMPGQTGKAVRKMMMATERGEGVSSVFSMR
ncbi:hypothetical protein LTS18_010867 [Coniosporium uncinatum]|uniref:Uncharacterized protein n=1 Tax=Coniosporium uncinatum TaxID=93489 RepID=A0ACC3D9M9_9PEZI|nr:hypothetical protein LTS18_010867 [Coniosporium uncinatum]